MPCVSSLVRAGAGLMVAPTLNPSLLLTAVRYHLVKRFTLWFKRFRKGLRSWIRSNWVCNVYATSLAPGGGNRKFPSVFPVAAGGVSRRCRTLFHQSWAGEHASSRSSEFAG
ncbi:hypothetical protein PAXRUDRAFT_324895 [Paxillus rubicundulus Ve08.2h10]|uniref:Uncharacterized protein n=1 Tax=Paxillus rubicundulus Ve08.2h10 TaxID=930991 RepID=A0A0D0DZT1_9AGAM|nr:hypothetical protein PAXRUDRAFT_324895 [Paxillus rubicundulus Ve08.2h10]